MYFDVIIRQWLKKKLKPVELFVQSHEWIKNMWSCGKTDTAHAQRSYLTWLTFPEYGRIGFKRINLKIIFYKMRCSQLG